MSALIGSSPCQLFPAQPSREESGLWADVGPGARRPIARGGVVTAVRRADPSAARGRLRGGGQRGGGCAGQAGRKGESPLFASVCARAECDRRAGSVRRGSRRGCPKMSHLSARGERLGGHAQGTGTATALLPAPGCDRALHTWVTPAPSRRARGRAIAAIPCFPRPARFTWQRVTRRCPALGYVCQFTAIKRREAAELPRRARGRPAVQWKDTR